MTRPASIVYTHPAQEKEATRLACLLGLPVAAGWGKQTGLILQLTDRHLELHCSGDPALTGPVRVEFVSGAAGYRRRHGGNEMLLRAVGHKTNRPPAVLDATGGLGRDAFILASHGCTVQMVERNPIIGVLLADGLRRALAHPETREAAAKITLHIADSRQVLADLEKGGGIEVVYLDPMFPQRTKSAKVKKELQVLQLLTGEEGENGELLAAALRAATGRVVVKRPTGAQPLPGLAPSHSHVGPSIRFDVYLRPGKNRGAAPVG